MGVRKIFLRTPKMTDEEIAKREGEYFEDDDFPTVLDEDADVYVWRNGKKELLIKFRKNIIPKKHIDSAKKHS